MTHQLKSLRDDQIADLACIIKHKRFGFWSDPGTGKTAPANLFMYWLWISKQQKSVFVMPISLQNQNKASFLKFSKFLPEDVIIVRGTLKQRQKQMANPKGKVFIMGFGSFAPIEPPTKRKIPIVLDPSLPPKRKRGVRESDWEFLYRHHANINACIVDEIHMGYGGITSKRTQWWIEAMKKMEYFLPLTGTGINGKLSTVYPTIHVIEPRYYFNYQAFLNEHAILDYFENPESWVNVGKVRKILEKHGVRRSFESIHGKESLLLETEYVEMLPKHRKLYDDFEATHIVDLDKEFIEAKTGGVAALRIRQLMQCPSVLDPRVLMATAKEIALERHILAAYQADKRIIIFGAFHQEQKRILDIFKHHKIPAGLINGTVPVAQRDALSVKFTSGELRGMVASPATVAVGFDWDFVDYMVFNCLDYQDSSFVQGYRRAIRGKRITPLLCYILEYENSRDQEISEMVQRKMQLATSVHSDKTVFNLTNKGNPRPRKSGEKLTMQTI